MNTATEGKPLRVLLDTNILISALVFGGKPGHILSLALENEFHMITSSILFAELEEVINKKFPLSRQDLQLFKKQAKKTFEIVDPIETLSLLKDDSDNRVLEAAVEGNCDYIVTGDKELLELKSFGGIKIVTPAEFFKLLGFD